MIIHFNKKGYYLCNSAIGIGAKKKKTKDKSKVTCKNCKKQLK